MIFKLPTECPFGRYYVCHTLVALTIAAALWWPIGLPMGLASGAAFYVGREIAQWESGLPFDWKGLAAPLSACLLVYLVTRMI